MTGPLDFQMEGPALKSRQSIFFLYFSFRAVSKNAQTPMNSLPITINEKFRIYIDVYFNIIITKICYMHTV